MCAYKWIQKILFLAIIFIGSTSPNIYAFDFDEQVSVKLLKAGDISGKFYQGQKRNGEILIGFEFVLKEGWKTYSDRVSDYSIPMSFDITKSQNLENIQAFFPKEQVEFDEILKENIYFYKSKVIVPILLKIHDLTIESELNIDISYGICKDVCVPVHKSFSYSFANGEFNIDDFKKISEINNTSPIKSLHKETHSFDLSELGALVLISALAFIVGVILNFMPCVLPILSLKIASIVKGLSENNIRKVKNGLWGSIAGIMSSFILFWLVVLILKHYNNNFVWGMQFQNPVFINIMILIIFLFLLSLKGFVRLDLPSNISTKIMLLGHNAGDFVHNFCAGITKVILTTSCSVPLLGTVMIFILKSSSLVNFWVFLFLGLGVAFPYILLLMNPKITDKFPKPGPWMEKMINVMAVLLVGTIIWLLWILSSHLSLNVALIILLSLFILGGLIIYKDQIQMKLGKGASRILILGMFILPFFPVLSFDGGSKLLIQNNSKWIQFDTIESINYYVKQGKTVFVDVTADWCITCKTNKILVINSKKVQMEFIKNDVILIRADFSKYDNKIHDYLLSFGRNAVPMNVIYSKKYPEGILLPVILSKKDVFKYIKTD